MSFAQISHPDDLSTDLSMFDGLVEGSRSSYRMEKRYLRADGTVVHALLHVGAIRDANGSVLSIIGQIVDVTDLRLAEQRLTRLRTHDDLTDLLNHREILRLLDMHLSDGDHLTVLLCDVDRFKSVNNVMGHRLGDQLLIAVAKRLRDALPADCVLGRLGSDEFIIVSLGGTDRRTVQRLGNGYSVPWPTPW